MDTLKKARIQSSKKMIETMETCSKLLLFANKTHASVSL